ncbi:membrane protein [Thalassospira profundimaris]|uniref:Membrane protein n=1 Tax=Thalassospira profundimaris TaxID=502049 RepID=A0A367XBI8_9PROT|nr:DUF475 domain-containing protein [Thalassospira profundimaris]RCK50809.1 membrane protein [Thalassospira profundimaris]
MLKYFKWAFGFTVLGLSGAFWLGWGYTGTVNGGLSFFLLAAILAILEISLSFDNAIVNANILKTMQPVWQRRFLTWGIVIAVFGMRIVFPLAVVAISAAIGPIDAVHLAISDPAEYARLMEHAHLSIAGFGGAFLMMVALGYFIDEDKEVDWLKGLEDKMRRCASVRGIAYGVALSIILAFSLALPDQDKATFLVAAISGLVVHIAIEALGEILDRTSEMKSLARAGGFGAFLYLEVLDASFSFDGVIGAFALTQNLFLIAIGLGIGAFYVRSMTIMLVERQTLTEFRYLEHGAFYSILALALIMFVQTLTEIPELVTGLIGASMIGLSFMSSVQFNRRQTSGLG